MPPQKRRAYPATVTADDDRVAVLMYHQFSQREHDITIAPERFQAQLRALKAAGYTFINPIKFAAFLDGAVNLTGKNVLITIDDGYQGVYDHALQVL